MDAATCDLCGGDLLCLEIRYVLDIRCYAAYDPLELSRADLERDLEGELRALIAELHRRAADAASAQQIADSVCKTFRFDLCPDCQRKYLAEPLGAGRPVPQPHRSWLSAEPPAAESPPPP